MSTVYLNGEYLPLERAHIPVLDRGFLFADGVYELIPVYGGRPFRLDGHLDRLDNSLAGIRMTNPLERGDWREVVDEVIERNDGGQQSLYLQVTRGSAPVRDHPFPVPVNPTVFVMSAPLKAPPQAMLQNGARVVTLADIRWQYCHLKTIALLPNVLMYHQAEEAGADEAILIRDGHATECTTANLFIVDRGVIVTPPKSDHLLPGITRDLILELAAMHDMAAVEADIPADRLAEAEEIWISSSSREVVPVTRVDGLPVGDGMPGPLWRQMAAHYQDYKQKLIDGEAD